ncbi:MAG TPA: hypothetical protein DCM02_04210 [Flavobacterium sp.]|nr:hypothetical protein [Flavobacterium sp.]HAT81561.1 hypothetical protein [Flavobacterium sp.]
MIKSHIFGILFFVTLCYGQEKIVLNENFNNNRNSWDLRPTSKEFKVTIEKGVLHLEKFHKNFDNRGCLWYSKEVEGFDTSKNFSIVVKAKQISNGDFTDVLDIQWGVSSKININKTAMLYQLNIFMSGEVRLDFFQKKWDNFNKVNIKKKLDEMDFDPKANNRYEILQEDAFVSLKINEKEVYKQYVFPIEGSSIGFQHCLKGAWEIDQIVVSQLLPISRNIVINETDSLKIKLVESQIPNALNVTTIDNTELTINNVAAISKPIEEQGLKVFKKEELVIYPNPFKEAFNVKFNLDKDGSVDLYVFSIHGQLMKTENKYFHKGEQSFLVELNVPIGVYIVRVITKNNENLYKRIVRIAD